MTPKHVFGIGEARHFNFVYLLIQGVLVHAWYKPSRR